MGVLNIICAIVLILASIAVIALVSMQESKRGMSALTGGQSEAIGRNYGRTRDAMLSKGTKVLTAALFVLTIIISIIDNTCVKLIGVVPYDPELIRAGNEGVLVDEMLSFNVTHAFDNIAARTLGEGRRLFAHIHRLKKLK